MKREGNPVVPLSSLDLVGRSGDVALRAGSRLIGLLPIRSGGERQLRGVVQDLPFLRRELAETSGLDLPLTHLRRHSAQGVNGVSYRLAPVRWQAPELRVRGPELIFLLRRQMLPGLHSPQHLLLAIGSHVVKALQSLLEFLLPVGRKAPKIPVVLERLSLLLKRLIAVLVQPLTGMMAFGGWLIGSVLRSS